MSETIIVHHIVRTPKGVLLHALSGKEYRYTTYDLDEILSAPGTTANIWLDKSDPEHIIKAQLLNRNWKLGEKFMKEMDAAPKATPPKVVATPKTPPPSVTRMDKSVALSYSKDFVINGFIKFDELLEYADVFVAYMTGADNAPTLFKDARMPKEAR